MILQNDHMDHLYVTNLVILHVKYVILSGGFKHANIQYCTPRNKLNFEG